MRHFILSLFLAFSFAGIASAQDATHVPVEKEVRPFDFVQADKDLNKMESCYPPAKFQPKKPAHT